MGNLKKLILLILISLSSFSETYIINKEHSKITFKVDYMKAFNVEGRFGDYNIFYEKEGDTVKELKGVIKVSSINTFDKKRDSHLKKDDFFDEKKFPNIEINSPAPFKLANDGKSFTHNFLLKIKGKERLIPFTLKSLGKRNDPWTKKSGHYFSGSASIDRRDFAIIWNKKMDSGEGFVVGNKIEISFDFEFYKSSEKPAFSRFYKPTIIKKKTEIDLSPPKNPEKYIIKKEVKVSEKKIDKALSKENIIVTLITGGIIFIFFIFFGIYGYKYLIILFEKMNLGETTSYILASAIIMISLIILSTYAAPYMGFGVNPLLD